MANPFFSGRIPPGLADKIDAHLVATGETRSELLVRLLRAEIGDNNFNNAGDNQLDNRLNDLNTRLERLEQLIDNKSDNVNDLQPFDEGWVNLATIAAQLQVLPKSISGAFIKRGRDIGNDTIEIEIADRTICKKGKGMTALYQLK
jgi:hypothetical protein